MSTTIPISHDEMMLMEQLRNKLLEQLTKEVNAKNKKDYDEWLAYMAEAMTKRGVACQSCRLGNH